MKIHVSLSMAIFSLLSAGIYSYLEQTKPKPKQLRKQFFQESDFISPSFNNLSNRDMSFSNPGAVSNTVEKLHRKIRSLRRQDLPMTSSTYPPSTPQPGTVSTPAYRSTKCQDIATEYAYREGLCGASDPEGYVSVARKRHTCKHRCGSARTLGEMLFKCSCDELCLIHKDCCKDFINECPKMYSKSQRAKMNVAHLNTDCKRTSFRVFTKGRPLESLWSTHEPSIENGLEKIEANTAELALGSLIWNAQFYQTADLASSIIYLNYNEFSDVALATSRPHFVPKLLKITCFSEKSNTKKKPTITKLLPLCFPEEISHMPSILHRSCQSEGVVSCHCDNGGVLHEFLHNACLGRNISVPDMPWQPMTPKKAYDLKDHPTDSVCMVSAEKLLYSKKRVGFVDQRDGKAIRAMVVPFFPETSYLSSSRGRDGDNFSKAGESRSHSEQELDPFTPQAVKFLVEFSNTREKRFLCPGNVSSLSKCRLLECAREALLSSHSATSARHVDDRSCEVPVRATVSSVYQAGVSVCTCLRVVVALADLRIWTTAVKRLTNGYCWIDLGILPVPNEDDKFSQVYTFPYYDALGNPVLSEKPANFSQRLQQQLEQTNDRCAQKDILVCFFSSRWQTPAIEEAIQCVKVMGAEGGSQYQTSPYTFGLLFAHFLIHFP